MPSPEETAWLQAFEEMECHLAVIDVALQGRASFPGAFATPTPNVVLPLSLHSRARLLLQRQRDVEATLRTRTEVLGTYLFGDAIDRNPTGVSVDVRS